MQPLSSASLFSVSTPVPIFSSCSLERQQSSYASYIPHNHGKTCMNFEFHCLLPFLVFMVSQYALVRRKRHKIQ